ncbi:hypothetical protein PHO31112_02622 [Pandoraea horticolens]|uniref:Uncharacterized protein n=1 Tax=Pandoraea horticolens TaxID=2508298 RepID=A0A5E4VFI3_9BURK|nr:hypothetical protein [Pandoraea horticolens]VVE10911.1 hypothetical protein PHO31112_02622 [Pandoraea horticolens]
MVTTEMLREWQRLGKQGIDEAGGLDGVAKQYGVASGALKIYLRADGTLTKRAEDRLNPPGTEVTVEMLRKWQRLGKQGIDEAGGLDGVARQYGVASVALRNYLRADGTLTKRAEDRLNPPGTDVTLEMLRECQHFGKQGIDEVGGLDGVARHYGVASNTLKHYLRADGTLTKPAEDRLNPPGTDITLEMLREWQHLGKQGIDEAGGLDGVAKQYGVASNTLKHYLRADGTLTKPAEDRLNPPGTDITLEMLRKWQRLGKQGIDEAGGLDGVASQYGVASGALKNYLRADGTLTKPAEDRLNPPGTDITLEMLRAWQRLGKQGIDEAGGLDGVAMQYGVVSGTLKNYLHADGTLTKRAEDRLNPPGTDITLEMLREWQHLGKQGIDEAVGLDGVAKQYGVASGALKHYLRADGTLTKRAEDRLNPPGTDITLEMLRAWQRLGKQGIDEAGGLDGVARQYGVASGALKNYLRADGKLTKPAEDRLNPPGADITPEMLRAWQCLGKQGIDKAGGLDGVARRDNVPATALRHYLRADGSLTPFGENRLRKAGTRTVWSENAMTPSLSVDRAKAIYRTAIDPRASDAESAEWWDDVVDEIRDVVASRTLADAAQVIERWHHDWTNVSDTARDAAKRIRSAARALRAAH